MIHFNHDDFKNGNIQELSLNEVDEIGGGVNPVVAIVVALVVVEFVAGAIDGWYDQGDKK